jgi:single-strand DNA-binding protein
VVSFFNVSCWGQLAESVCESLHKGDRVVVAGRLEQRRWETPEGDKRSTVDVIADDVAASVLFARLRIAKVEREQAPADDGKVPAGA